MTTPRLLACLLALLLAVPGAAFAQGAGDDQYQDPFGDAPPMQGGGGGGGGGLDPTPDVPGSGSSGSGGGSGGGGTGGGGGAGGAGGSGTEPGVSPAPGAADAQATEPGQLPNTGSEPLMLALAGVVMLLAGTGLRLRTIDPHAF